MQKTFVPGKPLEWAIWVCEHEAETIVGEKGSRLLWCLGLKCSVWSRKMFSARKVHLLSVDLNFKRFPCHFMFEEWFETSLRRKIAVCSWEVVSVWSGTSGNVGMWVRSPAEALKRNPVKPSKGGSDIWKRAVLCTLGGLLLRPWQRAPQWGPDQHGDMTADHESCKSPGLWTQTREVWAVGDGTFGKDLGLLIGNTGQLQGWGHWWEAPERK